MTRIANLRALEISSCDPTANVFHFAVASERPVCKPLHRFFLLLAFAACQIKPSHHSKGSCAGCRSRAETGPSVALAVTAVSG